MHRIGGWEGHLDYENSLRKELRVVQRIRKTGQIGGGRAGEILKGLDLMLKTVNFIIWDLASKWCS